MLATLAAENFLYLDLGELKALIQNQANTVAAEPQLSQDTKEWPKQGYIRNLQGWVDKGKFSSGKRVHWDFADHHESKRCTGSSKWRSVQVSDLSIALIPLERSCAHLLQNWSPALGI